MLESIRYTNEKNLIKFSVLDQLLLPEKIEYVEIKNIESAWKVIRTMQIRGAPLIAIVACFGLAVELTSNPECIDKMKDLKRGSLLSFLEDKLNYLKTSRPTAVNLFNAMKELYAKAQDSLKEGCNYESLQDTVMSYAEMALERDISDNKAIGRYGADFILKNDVSGAAKLMTICNTGSLATAGFGTALGVARELFSRDMLDTLIACETRPYNQGSRLTSFEIMQDGLPGKLICDSMSGSYMKHKGTDVCVVGADRICANGDTANKIGTYTLAIVARAHNVPFYVAAPFTTLDVTLEDGDSILIEERPPLELLESSKAPKGMKCWNPAFDVTPAEFITGIITEKGVIQRNKDGMIDVASFVRSHLKK